MHRVFVGLGSNRGDRHLFLSEATKALQALPGWSLQHVSSLYETEPVGNKNQPFFLNGVAEFKCTAEPEEILKSLKETERLVGRIPSERWGPREIDLDLLYVGSSVRQESAFQLPHPEIADRNFVLVPLAEIAPEFVDPVHQCTVKELLRRCTDRCSVQKSPLAIHVPPLES
ncbi:MAG TPA: 2-amino-4-hydroxy-6-hydroxymethyldihydropteridine diphosphokinase [Bacteroidetes bacterium]|nr:MAG: 2-amino-4-hydroxy-6-hydroxymethyldihydropteridine diphosphokinase [Ignavibacteria bacterium GWA2_54_16]HCA81690.1 2-amino-4-hydroxy-6-hydroxymethyldihydropteridine diphosphokinase [Bacteroidota bacterium]